jgi:probable HAF family extracellular repeat protein
VPDAYLVSVCCAALISADGRVVIGESSYGDGWRQRVFIWTPESGMRSLGALLEAAGVPVGALDFGKVIGVSPDGQTITGEGYDFDLKLTRLWQVHIDAAALRSLPRATPGADAPRPRAQTLRLEPASRALSAQQRAFTRGRMCDTETDRVMLARCWMLLQAARLLRTR